MRVGIASIKRWETGLIQSESILPYGPQLNNYSDLVPSIKESNENDAEPLNEDEQRIITHVAVTFPEERTVYEAAHREKIWSKTHIGALIPYSLAHDLTEI